MDPGVHEVDNIIAHRKGRDGTDFLVQWKNCSYLQATWEPEAQLTSAQATVARYMSRSRKVEVMGIDALIRG